MGSVTLGLDGLSDTQAALVRLLAVVESIRVAEERLEELVAAAREAGVDGWTLASALGIDRSTLYRRYPACSPSVTVS